MHGFLQMQLYLHLARKLWQNLTNQHEIFEGDTGAIVLCICWVPPKWKYPQSEFKLFLLLCPKDRILSMDFLSLVSGPIKYYNCNTS